jgi:hypothetical protein
MPLAHFSMLKQNDNVRRTLFIFWVRDHKAYSEDKIKISVGGDGQKRPALAHGGKGFFAVV